MVNNVLLLTLVLVYCLHEISPKSIINKCCGRGEFLMMGRCRSTNESMHDHAVNGEQWLWVPDVNKPTFDTKNISESEISYGHKMSCSSYAQDILNFSHRDFKLHHGDKEVHLEVFKEASLHDPEKRPFHSEKFPSSSYCIDYMPASRERNHVVVKLCPCATVKCVKKCCHDGRAFNVTSGKCLNVDQDDEDIMDWVPTIREDLEDTLEYYRIVGMPVCQDKEKLRVKIIRNGSEFILQEDGSIQATDTNQSFARDSYCGDFTMENQEMLMICEPIPTSYSMLYGVCFIIGAVALFLAVLVSLLLPEQLKKLHGRLSLAHNCMLFIGYVITGIMHIVGPIEGKMPHTCQALSFMTQFAILAAFFWLNVMCIDISWVFSGLRPPRGNAMQRESKKFMYYSLYAWGSTVVITIGTLIVEFSPGTRDSPVRPRFGVNGCFFNNTAAMLMFFYGPMSILLIMNILLFVYTAAKIIALKRQTAILKSTESSINNKNKQRLMLYLKLFCLMGVTWVFEVVSWAVGGPHSMWVFTDVINLLRGVFIFIIFCCKRKTYRQLRYKLLRICGRQPATDPGSSSFRDTRYTTSSSVGSRTALGDTPGGTPGGTPVANRRNLLHRQPTQVSKLSLEMDKL